MTDTLSGKPSCILIVRSGDPLNADAITAARAALDVRYVLESATADQWQDRLDELVGTFVLNFLSDRILKGPILNRQTVNFHPAPPEYPGRGTASYALFDNSATFGATAHTMASQPDSGDILLVQQFPIDDGMGCAEVAKQAEAACLSLLREICTHLGNTGTLPPPSNETWRGKPSTRKDFDNWLVLDPDDPEEFEKKIRCARHPKYPGPYVYVHGHRFSLADE